MVTPRSGLRRLGYFLQFRLILDAELVHFYGQTRVFDKGGQLVDPRACQLFVTAFGGQAPDIDRVSDESVSA